MHFERNVMRWQGERRSDNVEDRRGVPPAGLAIGGGVGTIIVVLIALFLGADPQKVLNLIQNNQQAAAPGPNQAPVPGDPAEEERADFVKVVLGLTEDVWTDLFQKMGKRYEVPKLDLFRGQIDSGCGYASAAVGPFYCPADRKVYIDLGFYDELKDRFKAPGEFAQAYVIAHEIGHHVQNLLGISDKVHAAQGRISKVEVNELSVRLELQADYLAGVWANHAQRLKHVLEPGDLEGGLRAASAIGDDRLQKENQGYVVPDSFTHGTSKQRVYWFRKGFETGTYRTGDPDLGDTFSAEEL
jgi:predicted metalloprotease